MAIAAYPAAALVIDGIWGQKSKEMFSWAFNVDLGWIHGTGTASDNICNGSGIQKLQKWLNRSDVIKEWKIMKIDPIDASFGQPIATDGVFGAETARALGAIMARCSMSAQVTVSRCNTNDFQTAGKNLKMLQRLMTAMWGKKPVGLGFDIFDNGFTMKYTGLSTGTWYDWGPGRYTG